MLHSISTQQDSPVRTEELGVGEIKELMLACGIEELGVGQAEELYLIVVRVPHAAYDTATFERVELMLGSGDVLTDDDVELETGDVLMDDDVELAIDDVLCDDDVVAMEDETFPDKEKK